jgi:predicted transcriptional regulator
MFKEYVNELLGKGLIKEEKDDKRRVFLLTAKGREFLEQYRAIENFIENFGL